MPTGIQMVEGRTALRLGALKKGLRLCVWFHLKACGLEGHELAFCVHDHTICLRRSCG